MNPLLQHPELSALDRNLATFLDETAPGADPLAPAAAAWASRQLQRGHSCLRLTQAPYLDAEPTEEWPSLDQWRAALATSTFTGHPGESTPLILKGDLLYLARYHHYETELAHAVRERLQTPPRTQAASDASDKLFSDSTEQARAAETVLKRSFSILIGGPGTGKTSTVFKILTRLLHQDPGHRVLLAAPTGKAAARLTETLVQSRTPWNDKTGTALPSESRTLHSLIGYHGGRARYHKENPLPCDTLIVDEASMIDLPLMHACLNAVGPGTRLVLLGDPDQLASVEAGSILGDLVKASRQPGSPLADSVATLTRNYRFGESSPIHLLCQAIREGRADDALTLLEDGATGRVPTDGSEESVRLEPLPGRREWNRRLEPWYESYIAPLGQAPDPATALGLLGKGAVLCALRHGEAGASTLNQLFEARLPENPILRHGQPFLVTSNLPSLQLYNGDLGVGFAQSGQGIHAILRDPQGNPRHLKPVQIPSLSGACAMTIHKSQGSEFDDVLVVLPRNDVPLLSRELLYTATSRARRRVTVWASPELLRAAINRPTRRDSGLAASLNQ